MSSCAPNSNWFSDYEIQADDYIWAPQIMDDSTPPSAVLGSGKEADRSETSCTRKRPRHDSCAASGTKACREKMRRDRLNDRFTELCSILDPGRPPKADKVAILSDATRLLKQLRNEAQKLKESNEALQDANKNLKADKLELKDEKLRLKAEKERVEQMLKGMTLVPPLVSHPAAAAYHAVAFAACNKNMPYRSFPPMGMWQWIPPTSLDTSQDHVLRPPVA